MKIFVRVVVEQEVPEECTGAHSSVLGKSISVNFASNWLAWLSAFLTTLTCLGTRHRTNSLSLLPSDAPISSWAKWTSEVLHKMADGCDFNETKWQSDGLSTHWDVLGINPAHICWEVVRRPGTKSNKQNRWSETLFQQIGNFCSLLALRLPSLQWCVCVASLNAAGVDFEQQ